MMNGIIVYDVLGIGKSRGRKAAELAKALGFGSEREVRAQVAYEREQGAVIASGNCGYYRPASVNELLECKNRLEAMRKGIGKALESVNRELSRFEGQQELDLYGDTPW